MGLLKRSSEHFYFCVNSLQKNYKHVKGLLSVSSSGEHCVLATNHEDTKGSLSESSYSLLLCNALGTPIDTKQVGKKELLTQS